MPNVEEKHFYICIYTRLTSTEHEVQDYEQPNGLGLPVLAVSTMQQHKYSGINSLAIELYHVQ